MSEIVIQAENLGKKYVIGHQTRGARYTSLRDVLTRSARTVLQKTRDLIHGNPIVQGNAFEDLWALRNVNFEIRQGEVVGIIGRNGAGKSTLLKILSLITDPTEGRALIRGRVSSLLEVGTGFHPELTGRENVYLNGCILGMSRQEIDRKFDEIVEFSGVEKFIDTPVKRYSSGMSVRLGFAVAAHLEPEILIVDEVLAVGDFEFQKKCLGKMNEVARGGRTVLFVSHNLTAVESLCERSMLLSAGQLLEVGRTKTVLQNYQAAASRPSTSLVCLVDHQGRPSDALQLMKAVTLKNERNQPAFSFRMGTSMLVEVKFDSPSLLSPVLGLVLRTTTGVPLFTVDNRFIAGYRFDKVLGGTVTCRIENTPLMPGNYVIDLYLGDQHSSIDRIMSAISFSVEPADIFASGKLPPAHSGSFFWPASWTLEPYEAVHHEWASQEYFRL